MKNINFIFNEDSFFVDYVNLSDEEITEYNDKKYETIYNYAFFNKDKDSTFSDATIYLINIAREVISVILNTPGLELIRDELDFDDLNFDYNKFIENKPYCLGNNYIRIDWLKKIVKNIISVYKNEIKKFDGSVDLYFTQKNKTLITPSRIFFHLVESNGYDSPFAFMATYTTKIEGKINHFPLEYSLKEYEKEPIKLQKLTKCLYKVAKESKFIQSIVESGEIFSPIFLSSDEAYTFLQEISIYENNGIICRIPNWWDKKNDATVIKIDIEQKKKDSFGFFKVGNLVCISPQMYYNGILITEEEIKDLLAKSNGLAFLKGKWIEIDRNKLEMLLSEYKRLKNDGTTISEVLKKYSEIKSNENIIDISFSKEDWLNCIAYDNLKNYQNILNISSELHGTLRKYQEDGYKWLVGMNQFNFGLCLADDMGLGKTIQILAFLLSYKKFSNKKVLLIVPASLIFNWETEIKKFAPSINYFIANKINSNTMKMDNSFLIITTYQISLNLSYIYNKEWGVVILDEAQAIKNPDTKQTRKIKSIKRDSAIALTGTPIENNLLNIWSIFDFLNPGLLGNETQFREKFNINSNKEENIKPLIRLIKPFILRRLKTDKDIIKDLPDKIENNIYTTLSKKQIILYNKILSELENKKFINEDTFTQKRILLTTILHLKQICNHPSQFLGDNMYNLDDSGKFIALKELLTKIFEKREKTIVFTQFKEITESLNCIAKSVFHKEGYIITGDTPQKTRYKYIQSFQNDDNVPYMILSLKTAGVGLNLTSATNVIHFDRWWNPAVENQATDRVYRIGQKLNVNVYKFITKNTIEEIIDRLMNVKQELSDSVIQNIDTNILNKFSPNQIISLLKYVGDENE